jgi:hypothetical protein
MWNSRTREVSLPCDAVSDTQARFVTSTTRRPNSAPKPRDLLGLCATDWRRFDEPVYSVPTSTEARPPYESGMQMKILTGLVISAFPMLILLGF